MNTPAICRARWAEPRSAPLISVVAVVAACLAVAACSRSPAPHPVAAPAGGPARAEHYRPQDGGPGLRMLREAAKAASGTSYQGVEMVSAWGVTGDSTMIADVWHRSGGDTLVRAAAAGAVSRGKPSVSDDADSQAPEGVLGITRKLVSLIGDNYDLSYAGPGSADSRPAEVVDAWREDGRLAARFWLDKATSLPLRRELYDTGAHLIAEDVFIDLKTGPAAVDAVPASAAPVTVPHPIPLASLAGFRVSGWPAPASLPGGLSLFEAGRDTTNSGPGLDLGYSDGLFVISVFVQRGDLAPKLAGWRKISIGRRTLYAGQTGQRSLTWSGRGFVFTVLADAPPDTLDRAVRTLPYTAPPGFWGRLSRGFGRLASWANPFG